MSGGLNTNVLTVNPTDVNQVGTYHVKLTVSNTFSAGGSVTINAIQIKVDCRVTSIANLVIPTDA